MKTISIKYIACLGCLIGVARAMNFEEYRSEVHKKNESVRAFQKGNEAASLKLRKAEEPSSIRLFSGADFVDDTRHNSNPSLQGSRSTYFNSYLGIKQQTSLGLQWSLSQNLSKTKVYGVSPLLLPQNEFYDLYPKAEMKLSLWRNLFGSELRAQKQVLQSGAELGQAAAGLENQKKEIEIEATFYKYGIQKSLFSLSELNLNRSQRLYNWVRERRYKNLVDETDLLQVQASVSLRELEFDRAKRNLAMARRDFNALLENDDLNENVNVSWQELKAEDLEAILGSKKISLMEKIKVNDLRLRAAQAKLEGEALDPMLDVYGASTFQGRNKVASKAWDNLSDERKNVWSVGVSFQIPLEFGLLLDLKKAARLDQEAQVSKLMHQKFDDELSWQSYQEELAKCGQSIRLLSQLEKSQQSRFFSEEAKYKKGRSTLFQVLIAEQDFINAQSQKLANELQCRVLRAQNSLYVEEGKRL